MDLHRSRSCATLIQSLYDIFVSNRTGNLLLVKGITPWIGDHLGLDNELANFAGLFSGVVCQRKCNHSINQTSLAPGSVEQEPNWCLILRVIHDTKRPLCMLVFTEEEGTN